MKDQLVRELEAQKADEPNYISDLTQRAAQEILRLRAQVMRVCSDREYIIGFNDGFECAEDQQQSFSLDDAAEVLRARGFDVNEEDFGDGAMLLSAQRREGQGDD